MLDLVERNDLYYKKFANVPFTGEILVKKMEVSKMERKDGEWLSYHENGQLEEKVNFQDGILHGLQEVYDKNGQLLEERFLN